ncbi:MAG: hypothetical protein GDA36_11450 [Rhodobacteraceae bacterium]|nr:hypothetical protein [Paracoccaceae bacterium]
MFALPLRTTRLTKPFDRVVSARAVSVGGLLRGVSVQNAPVAESSGGGSNSHFGTFVGSGMQGGEADYAGLLKCPIRIGPASSGCWEQTRR